MESEPGIGSETREGAQDALASIGVDRRRIWEVPPPAWLFEGLGLCMLAAAIVVLLLTGPAQSVLLGLDLVAVFCVVFAAQRRTGVVPRLTHLPAIALAADLDFLHRDHGAFPRAQPRGRSHRSAMAAVPFAGNADPCDRSTSAAALAVSWPSARMSGASPRFDATIHAANRLRICAVLDDVKEVEFSVLRDALSLSDSLLSKQLAILGQAGYLRSRRAKRDSRQRVWLALTREGHAAFAEHVAALREIVGDEGRRTVADADKRNVSARPWARAAVAEGTG